MSQKNEPQTWTLVTSHLQYHGLAFMEIMLKGLAKNQIYHGGLSSIKYSNWLDQYEMNREGPTFPNCLNGVILLVPMAESKRETPKVSGIRLSDKLENSLKDEHGAENSAEVIERFRLLLSNSPEGCNIVEKAKAMNWDDDQMHDLWQIIHQLPIEQQVEWFQKYSHYKKLIDVIESVPTIGKTDGRIKVVKLSGLSGDYEEVQEWLKIQERLTDTFTPETLVGINLRSTTPLDHLGWRYLKPRRIKLKNSVFFEVATWSSSDDPRRFRPFQFRDTIQNIFIQTETIIESDEWWCPERKKAKRRLNNYKKWNDLFSIVIFGPRGSGKSSLIREIFFPENDTKEAEGFFPVNCSSIPESLAEAELFGYVQGAFTGGNNKGDEGVFGKLKQYSEKTNNKYGVLFLDEFHHLPRAIQQKLLTAIQTDKNGNFSFRKVGSAETMKAKFQLILGTNWTEEELKSGRNGQESQIYPDFLERVLQRKISLPELKPDEIAPAWKKVWHEMEFKPALVDPLNEKGSNQSCAFQDWLNEQAFPGNFRDLQRLVIMCADLMRENGQDSLDLDTFEQLKSEWQGQTINPAKQHLDEENCSISESDYSDLRLAEKRFKYTIASQVIKKFGTLQLAAKKGRISESTLRRWKKSGW